MQDLVGLERQLSRALERIAKAADGLNGAARESQAVEEERLVNAQLAERLRAVKEKSATRIAELEAEVEALHAQVSELDTLRRAAGDLHEQLAELREGQPIEGALLAELESLRALRASDLAEVDALLAALAPHIDAAEAKNG
ncbi:hypothetical protein [Falsirhodobacter xinxiangensis]|uniref:hypothetical protein n=1 Tax=Falsirhodobacter xinxiangensis TaxID=2530049 RepID=UPI0010AAD7AA|nr:hypothetical protein [Rhodobacter xinxiangensis]